MSPTLETFSDDGFRPLFDADTLAGWHAIPRIYSTVYPGGPSQYDWFREHNHPIPENPEDHVAVWRMENGVLTGEQETFGYGGYLRSEATYGEFELVVEANPDWPADTGIMMRRKRDEMAGLQVLLDHRRSGGIGGFYGNNLAGFHALSFNVDADTNAAGEVVGITIEDPATTTEPITQAKIDLLSYSCEPEDFLSVWRFEDWNEIRVRCVGGPLPVLTSWINGLKIAELDVSKVVWPDFDPEAVAAELGDRGHLAFEVHDNDWAGLGEGRWGRGAVCRWRNARIKEL
jgi:hypothetical protein